MRLAAERQFVVGVALIEACLLQNASPNEQRQRAVHRSLADALAPLPKKIQNLFRLKMFAQVQDSIQNLAPRSGRFDVMGTQILCEGLAHRVRQPHTC